MEENGAIGGYGEKVREYICRDRLSIKLVSITLPDEYVEHGNVDILKKEVGIDKDTIVEKITAVYTPTKSKSKFFRSGK